MPPICDAVREAIRAAGTNPTRLAPLIGENQQTVDAWTKTREPKLDDLAKIEHALNLRRGFLVMASGYVAEVLTVEDAIAADPAIKPEDREAVLAVYRVYQAKAPAPPRSRRKRR